MLKKIILTSLVLVLAACAPSARNSQQNKYAYLPHTVSYEGETLALISRWYTGRSDNWSLIADANPEVDPRRIQLGQLVRIPQALLVTEEPLPQRFVARAYLNVPKAAPTADRAPETAAGPDGLAPSQPPAVSDSPEVAAIAPPENTLPESAPPSADSGSDSAAGHDKSRDELLNELLKE